MTKPSLSTGIGRTYQWCEGMEERRAADAIAEARMLIERNEPFIPCSEWTGTWYQRACVLECGESALMLGALAEALAAFVAD